MTTVLAVEVRSPQGWHHCKIRGAVCSQEELRAINQNHSGREMAQREFHQLKNKQNLLGNQIEKRTDNRNVAERLRFRS